MKTTMMVLACLIACSFMKTAYAEETVMEKVETGTNKAVDATKKTYRAAEDKSCEMVNGKMQCLGKKMKHKMQNASDKMNTKASEVKKETN